MVKKYKKVILIDLDGVLNKYVGNFDKNFIPEPAFGVEKFLSNLNTLYTIKIFTTRDKKLTQEWLKAYKLDGYIKSITNKKIPCFLHIDDRAICHKGDFNSTMEEIKKFEVYWKSSKI